MNICVLTHTFPRFKQDSTAAFMKPFVEGLVEAGNKVIVLTPYVNNFTAKDSHYKIIKYKYIWPKNLHRLGYSSAMRADIDLKIFNFILIPLMIFFGTVSLVKTIKRYKIDLINVHWLIPNGLLAFIASKITKVPYVITVPGTDAYLAHKNKIFALFARMIANSSLGIISNSPFLLKRIFDLGTKNKPSSVISYPVNINHYKTANTETSSLRVILNIKDSDLVILAMGRLVYKKGFEYLIRAIPKVIKKNKNIKLIIGGDGDLRRKLTELVNRLKINDNVTFVGTINRDETLAYYNIADIFVAPSVIDSQGNVDGGPVVSYESMACGKPQIATDILGVSNIIKNDINGYVVRQKSIVELAIAINKLSASKSLRDKMGDTNRKLILKSLSTKSIGREYTKFFNKLNDDKK